MAIQAAAPLASTLPTVELRSTSARLVGMGVPNGATSWAWFQWGPQGTPTNQTVKTNIGAGYGVVHLQRPVTITDQAALGAYEVRLVVSNSSGVKSGNVQLFTTGLPVVAWGDSQFGKSGIPAGLSNVVFAAGGTNQSFALKPDGALVAWGDNTYGQTNIPTSATNVVRISGGQYHNLALKADGRLLAWGLNIYGQATVPTWVSNDVVMAGAGKLHNLALKANGTVVAWGANSSGQTTVPSGLSNVIAVAAAMGGEHSLALRANGTVVAWGKNAYGQIGVPTGLSNVVAVAAGAEHSLALKADGTLVAWGRNAESQCNVSGLNGVMAIAAGSMHNLAVRSNGTIVAWGGNMHGQTNQPAAVRAVVALGAGNNHSLAVGAFNVPPQALQQTVQAPMNRDWVITLRGVDPTGDPLQFRITSLPGEGTQYRLYQCTATGTRGQRLTANSWVSHPQGQVVFEALAPDYLKEYANIEFVANDSESDSEPAWVNVEIERFLSFTLPPTEVHPTEARLWGLVAADGWSSWAWFEWWLLGQPAKRTAVIEAGYAGGLVRLDRRITGLAAGGLYGCRLVVSNELGEVRFAMPQFFTTGRRPLLWGNNIAGLTNVPAGLSNAVSQASRANVMLALDAQGKVWAWGSTTSILTAVPAGLDGALALAAGATHNVALKADRTVAVWGDNSAGQTNVPAGLNDVVAVAAGDVFSLALKADGKVVGWSTSPNGACVVPAYLDNVVGVAAGAKHAVALRGDGRLVAWGDNAAGQTNVTWLSNVVTVAGGLLHNVALLNDGTVAAWGDNSYGQCDVPTNLTGVVAVNAGVYHSLALCGDGSVVAWGQTNFDQVPAPLGLSPCAGIAGGQRHSAVLGGINTRPEALAQLTSGASSADLVVALTGQDLDGDALTFVISGLPTRGDLYQWDATVHGRGPKITTSGTSVSDSQGQVVFAPLAGGTGAPYATFAFRAVDSLTSSLPATVTINIQGSGTNTPPMITAQPQSRTNVSGSVAQFTVAAGGTAPLSYRWRRYGTNLVNGVNISGATTPTLTLSNVMASDATAYTAVVTNVAGTNTSQPAQLTIWTGVEITTQPNSVTNEAGTTASFSVAATGEPAPAYKWLFNGGIIEGATDSVLTLPNVQGPQAGAYSAVVSNSVNSATSSTANLTVWTAPQITSQPQSVTNVVGSTASFNVTATGVPALGYQWRFNGAVMPGASTSALNLTNVQGSHEGDYSVVVSNSVGIATSTTATLTVWTPPEITTHPLSVTNVHGSTATLSVTASGSELLSYQWRRFGTNLFDGLKVIGATTPILVLSCVSTNDAGAYSVVVSNAAGVATSASAQLTVLVPPEIRDLPLSLTRVAGASATFEVTAIGSETLTYQWRRDGTNLVDGGHVSGASAPTLTLAEVTTNDASSYSVVVENAAGSVTSVPPAELTVWVAPAITAQPVSRTNAAGTEAVFAVVASGTPEPGYQWQHNGADLPGQTQAVLTLPAVTASQAGMYRVVVSNAVAPVPSDAAELVVWTKPEITGQPQSRTNATGTAAVFTVVASGTPEPAYQWQHNGEAMPGATAATLTLASVGSSDAGSYTVLVSNAVDTVPSAPAELTVWVAPVITTQPVSRTNVSGTEAVFEVVASGTPEPGYQWQHNGADLPGQTQAVLTLPAVTASQAGSYRVVVSNAVAAVFSDAAELVVWTKPEITGQPQSRTNATGTAAVFTVVASGTPEPAYQWQHNGEAMPGATAATLTLASVGSSDAGSYTVLVSNAVDTVPSATAELTVWVAPAITTQPVSRTNVSGTEAVFEVVASGTPEPGYQWQHNGADLPGQTQAVLTLPAVTASQAGLYRVVVSNAVAAVPSEAAELVVWTKPEITGQPQSRTNATGTAAVFTVVASGTPEPAYQWQHNGEAMPGATAATLTLASVGSSDAGSYTVLVSNAVDTVPSATAELTVWVAPAITAQPVSRTNAAGTEAVFAVVASGTPEPGYQWQHNGADLPGQTQAVLTLPAVTASQAGMYRVVVSNAVAAVPSEAAELVVWTKPEITGQPQSRTNATGTAAVFTVVASGTPEPAYQWQHNGEAMPGATAATLTLVSVGSSDAGSYTVLVSNAVDTVPSAPAELTVWVAPAITTQPVSRTNVSGTEAVFEVVASGTPEPGYQWQHNGADLPGQTQAVLTLPAVTASQAGSYRVVVSNAVAAVFSDAAELVVWTKPEITGQPQSRTNATGTAAVFTVVASGTPEPAYQWQHNGEAMPGATAATLTLASVGSSDAGSYTVLVSNAVDTVPSATAELTVWVAPAITTQPVSRTNVSGTEAVFEVVASGTPEPGYQWQHNGADLPGQTQAVLTLPAVTASQAGLYRVVVSNAVAAVPSEAAELVVWTKPEITGQPQSRTNATGTSAVFTVVASGTPEPAYQWQHNGEAMPGATAATLTLASVGSSDAGSYTVLVSNAVDTVPSATAELTVWVAPAITAQPVSRTNAAGTEAVFAVVASGTPEPGYQWQHNGADLPGQTQAVLTLPAVTASQAGMYRVVVSNAVAAVPSEAAELVVWTKPEITGQPQSRTNATGTAAVFTVVASGTPEPAYQWQHNGEAMPGATAATLTLVSVGSSDAGSYTVLVSNAVDTVPSAPAELTVWVAPAITTQPVSRTNVSGTEAVFEVVASGTPEPGYQWQHNGADLPGQTQAVLTLPAVTASQAGSYRVVVSNAVAAVFSDAAELVVWTKPEITGQPQSRTNATGTAAVFTVVASGTPEPAYQWQHNGEAMPGATAATLTLVSVGSSDAGSYTVLVSNAVDTVPSAPAELTVWVAPAITAQPVSRTNAAGTEAVFAVVASGTPEPGYQWQHNGADLPGQTQAVLTLPAVTASQAGMYRVVVSNAVAAVFSEAAELVVWTKPEITGQPQSRTNATGTSAVFTVVASGTPEPAYQWRHNDADLPGATAATLTLASVGLSDAGSYTVLVSNAVDTVPSAPAELTVWVAPVITTQPVSRTNVSGTEAVFEVVASGTPEPGYQWQHNGADLAGQTQAVLTLPAVTASQAGSYRVVVSNAVAAVFSDAAELVVWTKPEITAQPQSRTNATGTSAVFTVVASGTPEPAYQWRHNDADLPGATAATLTLASVGLSDAGSYTVLVSNAVDTVPSAPAELTVWVAPVITTQPVSRTNVSGTEAVFEVVASGTPEPGYQWQHNGADLAGQTQAVLTLPAVTASQAGSYRVVVSNAVAAVFSDAAELVVWTKPEITGQPQSRTNATGTSAVFTVVASGTPEPAYQWRHNDADLPGATAATLTLASVGLSDAGSYTVLVSNAVDTVPSAPAELTVWVAPVITTQPVSRTNVSGTEAVFEVVASGTPEPGYQWQHNGADLAGQTQAVLTLPAVTASQAGSYRVVVSNAVAAVFSEAAELVVWTKPEITGQPQSRTNATGTSAVFTVVASGTPEPAYQWRHNDADLPGATAATLTLASVGLSDAGSYTVLVSNAVDTVPSATAELTVWVAPVITTQPVSRTNVSGTEAVFEVVASGTPEPGYQWQHNGADLPGQTQAVLTLPAVTASQAGLYRVVVSNAVAAVPSEAAELVVWTKPEITGQPQSRTNATGTAAVFTVVASGTPEPAYQWQHNGEAMPGATAATLTLASVGSSDAGEYRVVVSNAVQAITSVPVMLVVEDSAPEPPDEFVILPPEPGASLVLRISGKASQRYYIEACDRLGEPWTTVGEAKQVEGQPGVYRFEDASLHSRPSRLFRVRAEMR